MINFSTTDEPRNRRARMVFAVLCLLPLLSAFSARVVGYGASVLGVIIFIEALCCRRAVVQLAVRKHRTMNGWLLLIFALCAASVLWALDAQVSLHRVLKIAPQFLGGAALLTAAPAIARATTQADRRRFLIAYGLSLLIIAGDMLSGMKLHHWLYRGEAPGVMQVDALNRSVLCGVLFFIPALAFIFAPTENKYRWPQIILLAALVLLTLHSTGSQSAQLAFALMMLACLVPVRVKAIWYLLAIVIAALVFSAPFLSQFLMRDVASFLPSMPFLGRGDGYAANRIEIWDYVSRYALQHPWLGFGIDATRAVTAFDSHEIYQKGTTIPHPHNFAVQLWMEFGVVGAAIGSAFLAAILNYLRRQPSMTARRLGLGAFLGCLSCAAMTYSMWQGWWLGLLFLIAALMRLTFSFYAAAAATPDQMSS